MTVNPIFYRYLCRVLFSFLLSNPSPQMGRGVEEGGNPLSIPVFFRCLSLLREEGRSGEGRGKFRVGAITTYPPLPSSGEGRNRLSQEPRRGEGGKQSILSGAEEG
jgi:hypothetical protein